MFVFVFVFVFYGYSAVREMDEIGAGDAGPPHVHRDFEMRWGDETEHKGQGDDKAALLLDGPKFRI